MRGFQVEIIPRAVQVDRHEHHRVEPVLLPVGVRLDQQHFLGEPVGRVRLLRIAVPDFVLLERDAFRILGIRADGSDGDDLLHPRLVRLVKDVGPHHQVFVEKLGGEFLIGADPGHPRREVDDHLGFGVRHQPPDGERIGQVDFVDRRRRDPLRPLRMELIHDKRPEESGSAGDKKSRVFPIHGGISRSLMCGAILPHPPPRRGRPVFQAGGLILG